MRILMAAATCSPYRGSEHYVGWVWLLAAARLHDVHLLCADYDTGYLDRARNEGLLPENVTFTPVGQPVWPFSKDRFIARLQTWKRAKEFHQACARKMVEVASSESFDIAHHTSIATWRLGSPLVDLDLPLVWGPIGGGEPFPLRYLGTLTPKAMILELGRIASTRRNYFNPATRRTIRDAAVVISTNEDTENLLRRLGRRRPVMRCPMLLEETRFHRLRELAKEKIRNPKLLRIFSGGTLEGRKGVFLSLRALALLRQQGIPFHYTFGNHGPDGPACKSLAKSLGLEECVTFIDELTGDGYLKLLVESDVFLFPSLRDNSPLTLVEAMAAECLAIVLKTGGPGETVRPDCGVVLEPSTPAKTISEIASALSWAWKHPAEAAVLAEAAVDRVRNGFLSSRITDVLSEAYAAGTNR